MRTWRVRVTADIADELEVELEDATEEDAIEAALADWSFVEASNWGAEVVE